MGLSDQERIDGMLFAIRAISETGEKLAECRRNNYIIAADHLDGLHLNPIVDLSRKMWHGLLGRTSNATHWLFGSSSTGRMKFDDHSPWAVAVKSHWQNLQSSKQRVDWQEPFNALEYTLSIEGILGRLGMDHRDDSLELVYRIYSWCEQLIYYLRRYDDHFLRSYQELDEQISLMMGHCFAIFSRHDAFSKAYLLNDICKILYGNSYPYAEENHDVVTKWMSKYHSQHAISDKVSARPSISLEELGRLHNRLVRVKVTDAKTKAGQECPEQLSLPVEDELTVQRMLVMLSLSGSGIVEYDHILREFYEHIDKCPLMCQEAVRQKIDKILEKCKEERKNRKSDFQQECEEKSVYDETAFYGPMWSPEDFEEKEENAEE